MFHFMQNLVFLCLKVVFYEQDERRYVKPFVLGLKIGFSCTKFAILYKKFCFCFKVVFSQTKFAVLFKTICFCV